MEKVLSVKKSVGSVVISVMVLITVMLIGPVDYFTHGFFCETYDYAQIQGIEYYRELDTTEFKQIFKPSQKHFTGFQLNVTNISDGDTGELVLDVYNAENKKVESKNVDISKMKSGSWYQVYLEKNLEYAKEYTLVISAQDCTSTPYLQIVDSVYLTSENIEGNLLIGYAYEKATFQGKEKVVIIFGILLLYAFFMSCIYGNKKKRKKWNALWAIGAMTFFMTMAGLFNSFDKSNFNFENGMGSEPIVLEAIRAECEGIDTGKWSLGFITYNDNNQPRFLQYESQVGVQGFVFEKVAAALHYHNYEGVLQLICAMLTGVVFAILSYLVYKKYNTIMAVCFYLTFLLSPWTVNFARNVYWVEFTWFIPMIFGLLCSMKIESRRRRILCYAGVFFSILLKSLCGYEYISTIMIALMIFLMADFVKSIVEKNRTVAFLILRTSVILGIAAILGFAVAICIHASMRGDGSMLEGLSRIWNEDVLRRTLGGEMQDFNEAYWASFNASGWDVLRGYFTFNTQIIAGVGGNMFPTICLLPVVIFVYNFYHKKLNWCDVTMYAISFLATASWLVLAKQHAYVHTFLNYVLWYFGFVQMCFYVIVKQIWNRKRGEYKNIL